MKKIMVLQHVSFELLGNFYPILKNSGFRIKFVNFARYPDLKPELKDYDGLILLGGPMSSNNIEKHPHLAVEIDLIKEAIEKDIPVLGICLGAQLVAKALGATVKQNPRKEIGWYDVNLTAEGQIDPIFSLFDKQEKIFQWHSDTFALPDGAVKLASSIDCENQAFRYKDNVYGFQFHLEANLESINLWLNVPDHQIELIESKEYIKRDKISADTLKYIERSEKQSVRVFGKFVELFSSKNNKKILSSR